MAMNHEYEHLYREARDLQHRVYDALDDRDHPHAVRLRNELQRLVDDIQVEKNPRDLEQRLRGIKDIFHEARSDQHNGFMSFGDADGFHHTFEHLALGMRQFAGY